MALPRREREPGQFEGLVETSDRTEKELEPLRIMTFRMARVRDQIVALEEQRLTIGGDRYDDEVRKIGIAADEVVAEVSAYAEGLGQLDGFLRTLREKHAEAPGYWAKQVIATFNAVDVFLLVNGFVRTVEPPASDVAEEIWQRCLEEDLAAHTSYRIVCAGWRRGKERVPSKEAGGRMWKSFFDAPVPDTFGAGPLVAEWVPKWMSQHYRGAGKDGVEPILQIVGRQEPHYLDVMKLRFFKDTVITVLQKAQNDRARSTNDSLSLYAIQAATYIRKKQGASPRLPSLGDLLRRSRRGEG